MRGINYPASALVASLRNWFSLSSLLYISISHPGPLSSRNAAASSWERIPVLPSPLLPPWYSSAYRMNPGWSEFVLIDLPSQPIARALSCSFLSLFRFLLTEPRFTSAEPNYSPTAPRSTRSIRIIGGDSPRSTAVAAASVIGVSKGKHCFRRDEMRQEGKYRRGKEVRYI